ncbi:uncharacterized protein LOC141655291 [Silene latifolia]|uniref:uncharacterized protein LOC141655291 n=1 Tax=Silene latifolia TaxID=37657 RepID=UPI003D76A845
MALPRTVSGRNGIWVVVDRLTKSARFIPIRDTWSLERLAETYVAEVVRHHGVPLEIVSDRDPSYHASIKMAPFEALYGRRCRSPVCWDEPGDVLALGPDVSPMKGVKRFGIKGKLSPKFIGPYPIVERVGEVAYKLKLPASMGKTHDVFHVSQLRKYVSDPAHVIEPEVLEIEPDLTYEERPIRITDRKEKRLRNKVVPLVKVLWRCNRFEEETWETESSMRIKHPHLFD